MATESLQEAKAIEYITQADKKLSGFFSFGNQKYEDAEELYTKAGNAFKMAKKWQQAGDAFMKSAEMQDKLGQKHEVATAYVNASGCYKKVNTQECIRCLRMATDLFCEMGRFSIAAKHQKEIAELYEADGDIEESITNYELAAQYYSSENAASSANTCSLKVALFSAQLERYDKAIEIYEQVATASIDNSLLKWNVKDYFLHAGLCHLCTGEIHTAKRALERYCEMDITFNSTREYQFLVSIANACEAGDVEAFTGAVIDFDSINKLNKWKTSILLRIKNSLKAADDGGIL